MLVLTQRHGRHLSFWDAALAAVLAGLLVAAPRVSRGQERSDERASGPVEPGGAAAPTVTSSMERAPEGEEELTLGEIREHDLQIFIERSGDFKQIVDGMVRRVYEMRRSFVDENYESKIKAEEERAKQARRDAIAYFEAFLEKYPSDPPYTPDAMFRLAELYYDDSYIKYLDSLDAYHEAQERGEGATAQLPVKEFERTINLFRELVQRYPDYRNVDGAYYLLGYTLNDTGHEKEARLAWLNLVCANKYTYEPGATGREKTNEAAAADDRPSASLDTGAEEELRTGFVNPFADCEPVADNSRFFFEAWWLIGNYHFDYDTSKYGVETAIAAYKKLVEDPEHRFYDKGLYKLAWSYFKADMYHEAVRTFAEVVEYSDTHGVGKQSGMRPEAIQYLAVCFFTDDWNVDLVPDETTGIERLQDPELMPQDRGWTREVYARLGDIYYDNEKHKEAIRVWELFLEKWPLDVQAPFIQDKIADAYNRLRLFDKEITERSELDDYGPGSEWWEANDDHPGEQAEVSDMARDALINSALIHHRNAQALRKRGVTTEDPEVLQLALGEYNLAAEAYRKYIDLYPDTPDAYELNFQMADALFWSGQYAEAKQEYIRVRDSNLDDKYRDEAGHMVILCIEKQLEEKQADGELVIREESPPLEGDPPAPNPLPLPPLLLELMNEREAFLEAASDSEQAATFEYQAAQTYYRYGHWDEALPRLEKVYEKYCNESEVSIIAWKTLMKVATDRNDLDEKERLALLEKDQQCAVEGMELDEDESIDLGTLLGDVAVQRSMNKFNECQETKEAEICTEAGEDLVAAVGKAPQHQSADAALHNAALAYEHAQRFDTAMKIYGRIVDEYPESRWVDKCLFKQAYAANNFFEYEKALDNYKILADEKRFEDSKYRVDSIYNTAYILTNLQSYEQAVPYWERYAAEVDDPEKRIEARFNAADMHFRAERWRTAIKAYESFIRRYERNSEAGIYVVKASYRAGIANQKSNRPKRRITAAWNRTVELYKRLVNEPGSMSAEYAAESHFLLIEEDMRDFEKFEIKGSEKQIERKINEGAERVKEFEERYRKIQKYRRPVWSLAAEFRIGYAYEVYAKAIYNIPPPPLDRELRRQLKQLPPEDRELVMLEYEDKFRAAMQQKVEKMEDRAKEEYRIAVELAREGNISNEWTLLALERMNAYEPDNYPRQHNGVVEKRVDTVSAPPFASEVQ
ncbi:MAG: tetratricopeptide repeat protein [Polyangia bacterium]